MIITISLFAILRDRVGFSDIAIELPAASTAFQAAHQLAADYPSLGPFITRLAYAVNEEYVPADTPLRDGDALALIPPVSGG